MFERKFKELVPKILNLEPKDVKSIGILRQTLWNVKEKIRLNEFHSITYAIKLNFLNYHILF